MRNANIGLLLAVLASFGLFASTLGYRVSDLGAIVKGKFPKVRNIRLLVCNEIGAVTRRADVTNQIATKWSSKLYFQAEKLTYWQRWEGDEGSGMPIIRKDDLEGGSADTIKINLYLNLTGAGLTGDTTLLEGNEEKIVPRQMSFSTTRLKNAVRWGDLADLSIEDDLREVAYELLSRWLAGKLDDKIFNEFTGNGGGTTIPTKNKWAVGTATTRDTVDNTDGAGRLKLKEISRIKAYAQTELKIEPIKIESGEEFFGMVLHPYAALHLKIDDADWATAQREAQVRGADNPLFTGALGVWDGVILYEAQRVPRSANALIVQVADCIFFGAQAMSRGYMRRPSWREQEFSYGEEYGVATIVDVGQKINVFDLNTTETTGDATDDTWIGGMVVYCAAVAPTQP